MQTQVMQTHEGDEGGGGGGGHTGIRTQCPLFVSRTMHRFCTQPCGIFDLAARFAPHPHDPHGVHTELVTRHPEPGRTPDSAACREVRAGGTRTSGLKQVPQIPVPEAAVHVGVDVLVVQREQLCNLGAASCVDKRRRGEGCGSKGAGWGGATQGGADTSPVRATTAATTATAAAAATATTTQETITSRCVILLVTNYMESATPLHCTVLHCTTVQCA